MMDTKEALKELEDLTVDYGNRNEEQIARLDEAIDMAMDALRNLPNRLRQAMDTISRKGTIEAIQQHFNPTGEELPTELASVLAGVGVVIGTMPPAQPKPCVDTISRRDAIDALDKRFDSIPMEQTTEILLLRKDLRELPSAQPELAIPLQWIEAQIEWLKSLDNAFSTLTAVQISAMVNKWKDEQDE